MILGLRAAARELGISHVALLKAHREGRVQRRDDGNFDVDLCRAALKRNTNPKASEIARRQQQGHSVKRAQDLAAEDASAPPTDSIAEAARQLEWERLRKARLQNDEHEARLVSLAAVNAFVAGMIIKAREELLRIGPETRDDLARHSDPIDCERIVSSRIMRAVEMLTEYTGA